jgi:hypothetical protein
MNIENKTIWQCACGNGFQDGTDAFRCYRNVCLDWGVIVIGPGRAGPFPECIERYKDIDYIHKKPSRLQDEKDFTVLFAGERVGKTEGAKDGDIVVLRFDWSTALAVGVIEGDYGWHCMFGAERFEEFEGWDLEHYRRVRWLWTVGKDFSKDVIIGKDRFGEIYDTRVIKWVKELIPNIPESKWDKQLRILPKCCGEKCVNVRLIGDYWAHPPCGYDPQSHFPCKNLELHLRGVAEK